MITHFSVFAWKIPWTEEPDRLQSMGSQRIGYDWGTASTCIILSGQVPRKWPLGHREWARLGLGVCCQIGREGHSDTKSPVHSFLASLCLIGCASLQMNGAGLTAQGLLVGGFWELSGEDAVTCTLHWLSKYLYPHSDPSAPPLKMFAGHFSFSYPLLVMT